MEQKRQVARHPWEEWFSKGMFTISKGIHYTGRTHVMAQQVRNKAYMEGVRVSISINDQEDGMHVEVKNKTLPGQPSLLEG